MLGQLADEIAKVGSQSIRRFNGEESEVDEGRRYSDDSQSGFDGRVVIRAKNNLIEPLITETLSACQ